MNSICFFLLYIMTSVACIIFVLESTSLQSVLIPDHLARPWSTAWILSFLSTEMGPLSPWESLAEWSNKCINAKPAWRGHHHLPGLLPTVQSFVSFCFVFFLARACPLLLPTTHSACSPNTCWVSGPDTGPELSRKPLTGWTHTIC